MSSVAGLYDRALLHDVDEILIEDLRYVMCDDDCGLSFAPFTDSFHDGHAVGVIQSTSRFIQYQNWGVPQLRSGNSHPLSLSATEEAPTRSNTGIHSLRQALDGVVEHRKVNCLLNVIHADFREVLASERDVLQHRVIEEYVALFQESDIITDPADT